VSFVNTFFVMTSETFVLYN